MGAIERSFIDQLTDKAPKNGFRAVCVFCPLFFRTVEVGDPIGFFVEGNWLFQEMFNNKTAFILLLVSRLE